MNLNVNLSGIRAGERRLNVMAHNVANVSSRGFSRIRIAEQEAPTTGVTSHAVQVVDGTYKVAFNSSGDTFELSNNVNLTDEYRNGLFGRIAIGTNVKAAQAQDEMVGKAIDLKR